MEPATGDHRCLGEGRREQGSVETVFSATKWVSVDTGHSTIQPAAYGAGPSSGLVSCRPFLPSSLSGCQTASFFMFPKASPVP